MHRVGALLICGAAIAAAQTYTISTVAGGGIAPGQSAILNALSEPLALMIDLSQNIYVASSCTILVIDANSAVKQVISGQIFCGFSGDQGPVSAARIGRVHGMSLDRAGTLYFADVDGNRIRKIEKGIIDTVAGNGSRGYNGDDIPAKSASLNSPGGVAADAAGNVYFADTSNHRVRKVAQGVITTVAGTGVAGYNGDNMSAVAAQLSSPVGIALDEAGNLYVADEGNNRIRRISNGTITTVTGTGARGYNVDNTDATSASLNAPDGIALDRFGNLYIADTGNNRIRKVIAGVIHTIAGTGAATDSGDGLDATLAGLNQPNDVAVDSAGNIYIADLQNHRVRKISNGIISTVAGNGYSIGSVDGTPGIFTQIYPAAIAIDSGGSLVFPDGATNTVRKLDAGTNVLSTVAGNGKLTPDTPDNIPALSATFKYASALAIDSNGDIYLGDGNLLSGDGGLYSLFNRIRRVSAGNISTVASPVGPGSNLAIDSSGNLYFANYSGCTIHKVSGGQVTKIAGNGVCAFNGDGVAAQSAEFNYPESVAVDTAGNVYIADTFNNRVRRLSGGVVTTVANDPVNPPQGIAVDNAGNVYYTASDEHLVRKISNGNISTIAGTGTCGYNGDDIAATAAELCFPLGLAIDRSGTIYVAETNRIRALTPVAVATVPVTLTSNPAGLQVLADGSPVTTPHSFSWSSGSTHTISAITQTGAPGTLYLPIGSYPFSFVTPASGPQTVNINFATQYFLATSAGPGGTIAPASQWVAAGSTVTISATPLPGYFFSGFSGTLLGSANPQTITMNAPASAMANFTNISSGLQFYPVTPCRVADTRTGAGFSGAFGPPSMTAGSTRPFPIAASSCGIPSTAAAYSLNFTIVPRGPLGNLTTWPAGQIMPNVSTLNSPNGTTVANAAIVPAGSGGAINVYVTDATDVLFDINGYFAPPASGLQFFPVTPCRVADTRTGTGFTDAFGPPSMTAGSTRLFPIAASSCGIPLTAAAYSLNFTIVPPGPVGNLTTWPAGQPMPNVSTLNDPTGTVVANAGIVPAGANGAIHVFVTHATDLVLDVNGYFAQPNGSGLQFYPVTPCRVTDTRAGAGFPGAFGAPSIAAQTLRTFAIQSSSCVIPSSATAYSLNFTALPRGPLGYMTAWPTGLPIPSASILNSYDGRIVANAATVTAGTGGAISVVVNNPTDLLFDVNGYFAK